MASTGNGAGPYRVFVSHNRQDKHLARAVTRVIREAFGDRVEPYLAVEEVPGGVAWKEELQKRLRECDAVVSVMTRESLDKPWLYIEWSPFWLNERKFYVLVSEEEMKADLVAPMQATQVTHIQDPLSVQGFFRALRDAAGPGDAHPVPVGHVPAFVEAVVEGMRDDVAESLDRYAAPTAELPADERKRWEILKYFYSKGEIDTFRAIARKIRNDVFQADVGIWVVAKDDLETARLLCDDIKSAEHLCRVAWKMVEEGHADSPELRHVLRMIQGKNNAELRKLSVELLDHGHDDTEAFRYIIGIMSNMAELRKVAIRLVERNEEGKPVFGEIIDRINQTIRTPLRDVGMEFLRQGKQAAPEFERLLEMLITSDRPSLAVPILEELKRADPGMLPPLHARYRDAVPADNAALAWLAKELGLEAPA